MGSIAGEEATRLRWEVELFWRDIGIGAGFERMGIVVVVGTMPEPTVAAVLRALALEDVRLWRRLAPEGIEKPELESRPDSTEAWCCSTGVFPAEVEDALETVDELCAARRS